MSLSISEIDHLQSFSDPGQSLKMASTKFENATVGLCLGQDSQRSEVSMST